VRVTIPFAEDAQRNKHYGTGRGIELLTVGSRSRVLALYEGERTLLFVI
jgi:hypothetical protein